MGRHDPLYGYEEQMRFVVFGYNFPHWKTQNGIVNLVVNGFTPDIVVLQDRKELNFRQSKSICPSGEYLLNPQDLCAVLNIPFVVMDHDDFTNPLDSDIAIILGARILKAPVIRRFKGILNIHPGILPGNRGLDNLKWSLLKNLPIGVTAHFIDERIDMGYIIKTEIFEPPLRHSISDIYITQRNLEQKVLVEVVKELNNDWPVFKKYPKCGHSEKFNAVPHELDNFV